MSGKEEDEKPKWKGGTGHMFFTVESSGYEREGQKASERTKLAFMQQKFMLERSPNPLFGEIKEDAAGQYLVRMPEEKSSTITHEAESTMRNTILNAPDNTREKVSDIESRIRVDQLKHRREIVAKQLRDLEFQMTAGRAGYEANSREVGGRNLIADASGKQHGLGRSLKPTTTTADIGDTSAEDYNYYNGTGTQQPNLPNRGMRSTLQKFPALRTKSKLPRIPGIGFA